MKTALTIAGTDPSGGAGIQADIKTMTAHGVFAMSAVTALVSQNTVGVFSVMEVTPEFLSSQIRAVATDIFPDAVKTGMISSPSLVRVIAQSIAEFKFKQIVVDPVMVATNGARLTDDDAVQTLQRELLPLAAVITPNIPEAQILSRMKIDSAPAMEKAAEIIFSEYGCAVLVKGGHSLNDASDFLLTKNGGTWFSGKRIDNKNTHGTGCTLSSAIASNLAKGKTLEQSVEQAKSYISGCLEAMLDLGKGSGPLNHAFKIEGEY